MELGGTKWNQVELIFRVTNYDFHKLVGMKITGFIHNYPLLSTLIGGNQLSMENDNSLKYNSLILKEPKLQN